MRKKLMLLGKSLITFCLLWPIPIGFAIYYLIYRPLCALFNWMAETGAISTDALNFMSSTILTPLGGMPLWGISHGYWWLLLYIMAAGITFCLLSRYVSKGADKKNRQSIKDAPLRLLIPLIFIGLGIVAVFWAIAMIVVGLYHLFLTHLIAYSVPVLLGLIVIGLLIGFGVGYSKHHKE